MSPLHPPSASSALQLGHQGAQKWTTVTRCEPVAPANCCSIGAAGLSSARAAGDPSAAAAAHRRMLRVISNDGTFSPDCEAYETPAHASPARIHSGHVKRPTDVVDRTICTAVRGCPP